MAGARYANANVTYDLLRDFTPISLLLTSEFALVVNPALPVRDVKQLIAYAKANPGKVSYGTIGAGQMPYWNVMLFNSLTGVRVVEVPYKATPEVLTDIIAGRVDLGMPDWREAVAGQPMTPQDITDVVAWLASQRHESPGQPYTASTHPQN